MGSKFMNGAVLILATAWALTALIQQEQIKQQRTMLWVQMNRIHDLSVGLHMLEREQRRSGVIVGADPEPVEDREI